MAWTGNHIAMVHSNFEVSKVFWGWGREAPLHNFGTYKECDPYHIKPVAATGGGMGACPPLVRWKKWQKSAIFDTFLSFRNAIFPLNAPQKTFLWVWF